MGGGGGVMSLRGSAVIQPLAWISRQTAEPCFVSSAVLHMGAEQQSSGCALAKTELLLYVVC